MYVRLSTVFIPLLLQQLRMKYKIHRSSLIIKFINNRICSSILDTAKGLFPLLSVDVDESLQ